MLHITEHDYGIRELRLARPPVNALDAGLIRALAMEQEVEAHLDAVCRAGGAAPIHPTGAQVGRIVPDATGAAVYLGWLGTATGGRRLDGMVVALDCAHGAASTLAPEVFTALGATVRARASAPREKPRSLRPATRRRAGHCRLVQAHE